MGGVPAVAERKTRNVALASLSSKTPLKVGSAVISTATFDALVTLQAIQIM